MKSYRLDAPTLRRACRIAAGFTLLQFLLWRRLWFAGQIPVDGNVLRLFYPNWVLFRNLAKHFWLPLWNPYRNMGEPFLADPQAVVLYPIQWILAGLSNFRHYLALWIIIHSA